MRNVLREEFLKVYIRRHLWLFFVVVMVISVYSGATSYRGKFANAQDNMLYQTWMKDLHGAYQLQAHESIKDIYQEASRELKQISDERMSSRQSVNASRENELISQVTVSRYLDIQLDYVAQNPTARQVIDPDDWDPLLGIDIEPNLLSVAFVVILAATLFDVDNNNQMDILIDATTGGQKYTVLSKWLLLFMSIMCLVFIPEMVKLIHHFPQYWSSSVQSYGNYQSFAMKLSLGQTYLLLLALKLLGYGVISAFVVFLMQWTRQFLMSILSVYMIAVGPYILYGFPTRTWLTLLNLASPEHLLASGDQSSIFIFIAICSLFMFGYFLFSLHHKKIYVTRRS